MGHEQELREFVAAVRGQSNQLLSWEEACAATTCMFAAQESIRSGQPIEIARFRQSLLATETG